MRYRALFALLVPLALGGDYTPTVMDDSNIRTAVAAWLSDPTGAEAMYGHISTWATGGVTDMSTLISGAYSFNDAALAERDVDARAPGRCLR